MLNKKRNITYFSLAMNVFLTALKIVVSFITGSTAIFSEAIHSGSDLLTSIIALFSVREAEKPPDHEHPYGHGKFENIASLFEGLIIFGSGLFIIYRSVQEILSGAKLASLDLGMTTMLIAAVLNWFVSSLLIKKGRELESPAIEADGWHSRTDVFTATGVMVSLIIVRLTGFTILDPVIALMVAGVILWIAGKIMADAFQSLIDTRLPDEEEKKILTIINSHSSKFLEFHKMRTRKKGGEREIDLHLVFPDDVLLKDAHNLTDHLEDEIRKIFPNCKVLIHAEPCEKSDNLNYKCSECIGYKRCIDNGYLDKEIKQEDQNPTAS